MSNYEQFIWQSVPAGFVAAWAKAVAEFREGNAESVDVEFGIFGARLYDLKNNDDRETVRIPLDDFGKLLELAHANGAFVAADALARVVTRMTGHELVEEGEDDE